MRSLLALPRVKHRPGGSAVDLALDVFAICSLQSQCKTFMSYGSIYNNYISPRFELDLHPRYICQVAVLSHFEHCRHWWVTWRCRSTTVPQATPLHVPTCATAPLGQLNFYNLHCCAVLNGAASPQPLMLPHHGHALGRDIVGLFGRRPSQHSLLGVRCVRGWNRAYLPHYKTHSR